MVEHWSKLANVPIKSETTDAVLALWVVWLRVTQASAVWEEPWLLDVDGDAVGVERDWLLDLDGSLARVAEAGEATCTSHRQPFCSEYCEVCW